VPITAELAVLSLVFATLIAVPIGVASAVFQDSGHASSRHPSGDEKRWGGWGIVGANGSGEARPNPSWCREPVDSVARAS
jgi:hypothetical protein